jgi:hypothetical protein
MVLSLVLAALAGVLIAYTPQFAARRAAAQPLPVDQDAEAQVLAAVAADPSLLDELTELGAEMFTLRAHSAAWERITADPGQVAEHLAADPDLAHLGEMSVGRRDGLRAASTVYTHHEDRTVYVGGVGLLRTDDPVVAYWRPHVEPRRGRIWAALTLGPLGIAAATQLGQNLWQDLALFVAVIAGLVIAFVDIDTLLIDLRTLFASLGVVFALLTGDALTRSDWSTMVMALGVTAAFAVFLFTANAMTRLLRGVDGMGMGDLQLLPLTVAVPAAIAGTWMFALHAFLGALLIFLGQVALVAIRSKRSMRGIPYPFGPALTYGWVVAAFATTVLTLLG